MSEVELRPMTEAEFTTFRARAISDYAAAKARAGDWDEGEAEHLAAEQTDGLLPQGPATPGMLLLTARSEDDETIGRVWIALERAGEPLAWIYVIEVDEEFRGQGFGAALLAAAEEIVRDRGATAIGLNVFADNAFARRLYASSGYEATSVHMRKGLG